MFRTLNRWGHYLPGLRIAEPAGYIMIGVIALLILSIFIVFHPQARKRLIAALIGSALWTWFCGLTVFHLWLKAGFAGVWDKLTDELVKETVPAYWVVGCLFICAVYVARRLWHTRFGGNVALRNPTGFPVIAPHEKEK